MNIGIEIEFTGVSRLTIAKSLEKLWSSPYSIESFDYLLEKRTRYKIEDNGGKSWYIYLDKSIRPSCASDESPIDYEEYMCELVSPVLDSRNTTDLEDAIRVIRRSGGFVNETCGIHIHIDYVSLDSTVKLFTRFFEIQGRLPDTFGLPEKRMKEYCKLYSEEFISCFKSKQFHTEEDFLNCFYFNLAEGMPPSHPKNLARYYMLNADSIYKQRTIEFRFFNSSLGIGVIRSYIQWVVTFVESSL